MLLELRVRHGKSSMPSAPLAPETAIAASLHKLLVRTDKELLCLLELLLALALVLALRTMSQGVPVGDSRTPSPEAGRRPPSAAPTPGFRPTPGSPASRADRPQARHTETPHDPCTGEQFSYFASCGNFQTLISRRSNSVERVVSHPFLEREPQCRLGVHLST